MFSRLHRRRSNLQDLGRLSKSCPAVDSEAGDDDESEETSSSESWGSAASLSDPFAESSEEVAAPISRAEKQLARQSLRHAKKRESQKKRNMEQNKISMDDYLGKQTHFRMWLHEEQKKQAKDLSSPKRKTYFKMFVRLWNKRHLPPKYYETRQSWHTEGEGSLPAERRSPLGPERFSLLQNSPAMDPTLFPHTIDLSSDSIALPAASPSSFSTFGKSTPLSASLPFKFTGTDGKKALSEHIVTPRSAAADKRVFKFGEDKENRAHHSLPACMATAEHLRTATISPRKKMVSACQARSLDRVVVNWSPRGQLKLNPVDSPRCPSPFASHPPSPITTATSTTTTSGKEEADKAGSASASPLISDVYHQVKDILPSGSPVYAELPAASGMDDSLQMTPVPPVQITTKSKGHRRRSRSVDEAPLYAVPSKQVRDRAWSEKRPVSEEVDSLSPPPIPPKRFDPHVEGLGIPFSSPVLVQKVNTNTESQVNETGGDGGIGGKENTKKSGKMFKFSWFGKKLTSRRRSRSCEALSPSEQRGEETSLISPFPLVKLDRSPTLSRRVLARPLKPPGKQPEVSQKKQTGNSSPLPQATEKKTEMSLLNHFDVTQHPSSQAREAGKQANSQPAHKLKFELTEYSSSPMRLGGGDRLVTFGVTGERNKRGTPLRRRSRSLEHIPSAGQDCQLKSVNVCDQVPEDPVRCELYDEVKSEVRNELSSLVNKLQQRSGADLTQTLCHHDYTSVEELQSSPKRLGRREKPEETSCPEQMDLQVPCPEFATSEEEVKCPPCVPDGVSSQSRPGAEQTSQEYHVTDNDVVMKDATEEEEPAIALLDPEHHTEFQCTGSTEGISNQSSEGTAELQCTHNTEGFPQQKSYVEIVDMQNSPDMEMSQHDNSEEMTDVPDTENIKESPQQSSIEETSGGKIAETDDNTATPLSLKIEQVHVPESPDESLMELTNAVHSILQKYTHLPTYTDLGLGEGLSASSTPQTFLPNENSSQKDIQLKPVLCETPSQKKIVPAVRETPSQKEVVHPPSHHEEVAFSVTIPTAQLITQVTKPLTPRKRGPQRRRSRSVDMSLSGFGSVETVKIQAHTSSSVVEDMLSSETAAKKCSAEEEQPVNETKKSDIIHPVVQVCKQPPPILPKTQRPLKTPMFTENKAMSLFTVNDDPRHTLPKAQTPVKTQAVTDGESTSQLVMDHQVTPVVAENATLPVVTAIQHGGPWRPVTRLRNRRRSRSVGDLTAIEGKESGVDTEEGKGFANVRAFWDSMRGRAGEERGSGMSLQRKPSTMRRLQQQLFGTKDAQGDKELASHPQPPVTPQHLNVVQSTPSSDQDEASSAVTKLLPPPSERNTVSAKDTTTVHEVSQTKSCTQDNVQKINQPVTPLGVNKAVGKTDAPVSQPLSGAEHVPPSPLDTKIEPAARSHHYHHPAELATQERSAGKEEEKGPPIHRSPFVTVRRQSSRKRSILSESGTPGTGSPHCYLNSPQEHHGAQQEQSHCHASASVDDGNSTPTCSTQTKSLEGSGNNMKADQSFGADLKATPVCFTNLKPHRDQGGPFTLQTACSPSSGKKKPQPPKPPPKPTLRPFKEAANQRQGLNSPSVLSTHTGRSSREQSAVTAMAQVSGGVRTRKRRSQELEQAGTADKQTAVGDRTNRPAFKMATYDNSVVSSHPSSPHSPHCSGGQQKGGKVTVNTAMFTGVRRVKRRSGDEQDECDLRPVKRRSSGKDKDDHIPPAVTRRQSARKTQPAPPVVTERKESLKREERQSPIGQRVNRGEKPSPAQNKTKTDPAAVQAQTSGKEPSSTPTPKWSSVRSPVTTSDSSRTSIGTARRSSGRVTVTPHNSTRTSIGSRQSSSRVTVTRQVSSKSSTGRRQSGAGETPGKVDNRRQSGGRATPARRESDRRQSGGGKTPTRDGNRRQSGGRGTPTRTDSDRRESGVRGTVTRTNSSRTQGSGVNRPQGQVSTPVRTNSSARKRSGVSGAAIASKRCSTGSSKSQRDSGGVKRSDSSRVHKAGDAHSNTPSRSGSVRKQGPKTSQSPTFMRITRTLGVYEEQNSDVHENHFTLDEEQAEKIIAGLQKAQEKASELGQHDKAMIQKNQQGVQIIPPMQAGPGKTAQPVSGLNEDEGQRERVEDMETDIDSWEEGGLSSGAREVSTTPLSTLV